MIKGEIGLKERLLWLEFHALHIKNELVEHIEVIIGDNLHWRD